MRFYRALLLLYPASFRAEYGEEMCGIFRRRRRDASGLAAVLALLLEAAAETACNAGAVHWDIFRQDLRYASRTLRRDAGFTLTAVLVASLGIGATTAAFSLADPVLIRRPPFPDAGRLVRLWETRAGTPPFELSPADYRDWKRSSDSFEAMGCFRPVAANFSPTAGPAGQAGAGDPERVQGAEVTAGLLPMLGAQTLAGRLLNDGDEGRGTGGILMREGFASVGKQIVLDGTPYVVAGVLPRDFRFPGNDTAFWRPMRLSEADFAFRNDRRLQVIAKLRPGVTIAAARAEVSAIAREIERSYPSENKGIGGLVTELAFDIEPRTRLLIIALCGAALCVLLTACANLANLLLARASARRNEMAVRIAIGGGRERLVRQAMTESLLLAMLGGGVGVMVAMRANPVLAGLIPGAVPVSVAIDWRVMLFAALVTAVTGAGFGVIPALQWSAGADKAGRKPARVRSALVISEVAGSLVLLVAAGLLLQTLWKLRSVSPGFQADDVVTMRTALPMPRYASPARREQFYIRVLAGIRQLPNVSAAGYVSFLPMAMKGGMWPVLLAGRDHDSGMAIVRFVTPGFFETLRIPILRGREPAALDRPLAAVVSESFARRYWAYADPLGRRFRLGPQVRQVVAIVGDIHARGIESESEPQVYLPYQQVPNGAAPFWAPKDLVVRTTLASGALAPMVRDVVRAVDPEQPVSDVRSLSGIVDAETAPRAIQAGVVVAFAAISIVVAAIGIGGFLSFVVSQRAREIGIRIALGAQPREILEAVFLRGLALGGTGIALGSAIAVAVARTMRALLWGVGPADPIAVSTAVALTLAMTLAGTVLPAIRAARVDPMAQIRPE